MIYAVLVTIRALLFVKRVLVKGGCADVRGLRVCGGCVVPLCIAAYSVGMQA